ncbi:MAG: TauD/TfdA family dioxygenase [Proteobacteria bacterium]|nr:TauD/TfdA family dioxygenase [Pseudomonadota bacterium]
MSLTVKPLTVNFCAEIGNVDITAPLEPSVLAEIRDAYNAYAVLIFHDQPMDDDQQLAFSRYIGSPKFSNGSNPTAGTPFSRQSNLDIATGEKIPWDDRRMLFQKGNMLWHMDSSFKPATSLCSILTAREVPPEGGNTEFASTRLAYDSLSEAEQAALVGLEVEHDIRYSREQTGFKFDAETDKSMASVVHKLVRTNAGTGRKSLLIGGHARAIVGWSEERSRVLLDDLLARAERHTYSHQWRQDDVVIWDNQAALHRATPYDARRYRRLMQRTTIALEGAWPSLV